MDANNYRAIATQLADEAVRALGLAQATCECLSKFASDLQAGSLDAVEVAEAMRSLPAASDALARSAERLSALRTRIDEGR